MVAARRNSVGRGFLRHAGHTDFGATLGRSKHESISDFDWASVADAHGESSG
jgi:hypothetical protein